MKGKWMLVTGVLLVVGMLAGGCGSAQSSQGGQSQPAAQPGKTAAAQENTAKGPVDLKHAKLKITVGDQVLWATVEDNATMRALAQKLPLTLDMQNLSGREMCYRFGAGTFPTEKTRSDRYAVGDLVYWAPRGSFVILYKQNGEEFERQQLGHIDQGVELFDGAGDKKVTFELQQ